MVANLLKSKKLPIGVFAGVKKGPGPARIFITLRYSEKFEFLSGTRGFKFSPIPKVIRTIQFEMPVTPPTIEIDFGNEKDSEKVARVGEVVLPKYKKAIQFRWESFFPYDSSAPYLNTSIRNLSWGSLGNLVSSATNLVTSAIEELTGLQQKPPTPSDYINIFNILSKSEQPFTISMTFYDGGHIDAIDVTLDSFKANPENNGDYTYSISLIEWVDIKPKLINPNGSKVAETDEKVQDSIKFKTIRSIGDFWKFCKQCYPIVSKKLIWAFATYNGVRNLIFDATLKAWKIKGTLQDLGGRFGILSNIIGVSKITSKDTQPISQSLKKLSYTKASQQMADFIKQNMSS